MDFFFNELSIHEQFQDDYEFRNSLKCIMDIKGVINEARSKLYCTGNILQLKVTGTQTFQKSLSALHKDIKNVVLTWISKEGPFWEKENHHDDNIFYRCNGSLINDFSLAESAWRIANNNNACVVSMSPSDYDDAPLVINIDPVFNGKVNVNVDNFWDVDKIKVFIKSLEDSEKPSTTWRDLFDKAKSKFKHLLFADKAIESLRIQPFSEAVAKRMRELLRILNELNEEIKKASPEKSTKQNDEITQIAKKRVEEIKQTYFTGKKALFTDESDTNKSKYKNELTFRHPGNKKDVLCSYHGKIRSGSQYRIHFEWPKCKDRVSDNLYIAYIGPKITKD